MSLSIDEHVPPHNLDAERALLGAIVVDGAPAYDAAAATLDGPDDLYRDAHRRIYRACGHLRDRALAIDALTVIDVLRTADNIDDVGGPAYVMQMADGVARGSHIDTYAAIIREHAKSRALLVELRAAASDICGGRESAALARLSSVAIDVTSSERAIRYELERERVRREARRRLDAESTRTGPAPYIGTLADLLAEPDPPMRYRIEGWQPAGSRVMVVAPAKSGKTTLVGSLVRALVDGDRFLDAAHVTPVTGTVAIIDVEMARGQVRAWLRDQQIRATERVLVVAARGAVSSLNVLDARVRGQWADALRAARTEYLVIDCLRPILDALGLDEQREAGRLLVAIDALLAEAGIAEAAIVHHMGHSGERARGDSRLVDWPDATWRIVRDGDDPAGPRYLTAYGRDVDQPEARLDYEPTTRRLTISGGSRRDAATDAALDAVVGVLADAGAALSVRAIERALADTDHGRAAIRAAIRRGVGGHKVVTSAGPRGAVLHTIPQSVRQCAGVRQ